MRQAPLPLTKTSSNFMILDEPDGRVKGEFFVRNSGGAGPEGRSIAGTDAFFSGRETTNVDYSNLIRSRMEEGAEDHAHGGGRHRGGDKKWAGKDTGSKESAWEKQQRIKNGLGDHSACPSMFVAVVSSQENTVRRNRIRKMWQNASYGWGQVKPKFAVCRGTGLPAEVEKEAESYSDMLILDCEEGYLNGKLTLKVLAAMEYFIYQEDPGFSFFMKIDDDTFASVRRLCDFLAWRVSEGKPISDLYMGVFAEGSETLFTRHKPCKDPTSPWFEPEYNEDFYPVAAKGGPGYILPRHMVGRIVSEGIPQRRFLHNEDKAVGVWVDELAKGGSPVTYVNLPGTDGYDMHMDSIVKTGPYWAYPHYLHHHLQGPVIGCLSDLDHGGKPERWINGCFELVETMTMP